MNGFISSSNQMFDDLTAIITNQMHKMQSTQVLTKTIQVDHMKKIASSFSNKLDIQDCFVKMPNFCNLISSDVSKINCENRIITQRVNYI